MTSTSVMAIMKGVATSVQATGAAITTATSGAGAAAIQKGIDEITMATGEMSKNAAMYLIEKTPEVASVVAEKGIEITTATGEMSKNAAMYLIEKTPEVASVVAEKGVEITMATGEMSKNAAMYLIEKTPEIAAKGVELADAVPPEAKQVLMDGALCAGVAAGTFVGAPLLLSSVGFGAGGIAAGSAAAKLMSVAWKAKAGMGAVSLAQSIGAAGISGKTAITAGSLTYAAIKSQL